MAQREPESRAPRRRRRPEEAEAEILHAARELLRERPLHEITIDALMQRTTLSRKSFYVYFADRYELLARLFAPLRARLDAANAVWLEDSGDPVRAGRESLRRVAAILVDEGVLVRALHDAARYDPQAGRAWREFNDPVVQAMAQKIAEGIDDGLVPALDPDATARRLVGMNLFCFFDELVGNPDADVDAIVDSLVRLWLRALTLRDPLSGAG